MMACRLSFLAVLLIGGTAWAQVPVCDPGEEQVADTPTHIGCLPMGAKLPIVPGGGFSAKQCTELGKNLELARNRQTHFDKRLAKIDGQREKLTRLAREMDGLHIEVLTDSALHTMNILKAAVTIMGVRKQLPAPVQQRLQHLIAVAQTGITAAASAGASDATRHMEKAVDATAGLAEAIPASALPPNQAEPFRRALAATLKLVKISERHIAQKPSDDRWTIILQDVDDAIDAVGDLFAPLKVVHSGAHILVGELAQWALRRDRNAIDEAFVQSAKAKRYYLNRRQEAAELALFLEEALQKCPAIGNS